ncbi:Membrane trafficking and cell signaling protein, partial [Globisporangium splendens]
MSQPPEAIRLAQASDWKGLQRLIDKAPECAREHDEYGMLPVHWACTESCVPLALLDKLLCVYPEGVRTKNEVHLLPLHIAIRAHATPSRLERLLAVYPGAVHDVLPDGLSVLDLADKSQLGRESRKLLVNALKEDEERGSNDHESPEQDDEDQDNNDSTEDQPQRHSDLKSGSDDDSKDATTHHHENKYHLLPTKGTPSPAVDGDGHPPRRYSQLHQLGLRDDNNDEDDDDDAWPSLMHGISRLTSTDTSDAVGSPLLRSMSSMSDDDAHLLGSPHGNLISPSSTSTSSQANSTSSVNSAPLPMTVPISSAGRQRSKQLQGPFHRKHSLDYHHAAAAASAARQHQENFAKRSRNQLHTRSAVESGERGGRHQSLPVVQSFENFQFTSPPTSMRTQHDMYHDRSSEEDESEHARRKIHLFSGYGRGRSHGDMDRDGGGVNDADGGHFESPPEWQRDDECSICRASFGMFKHRHHCRNCGKSICSQHSADRKIAMTSKGFKTPQRVCVTCYAVISHTRARRQDAASPSQFESMLDSAGISTSNNPVHAFAIQHQQQLQMQMQQQQQQQHYAMSTQLLRSPRYASSHKSNNGSPTGTFASTQGSSTSLYSQQQQQQAVRHTTMASANNGTNNELANSDGATAVSRNSPMQRAMGKDKMETQMLQAQVSELCHVVSSQKKQIEQLVQTNIQMQQQILEQEELKAETMLLITQLMTRVSVLEMQKVDERKTDSFTT